MSAVQEDLRVSHRLALCLAVATRLFSRLPIHRCVRARCAGELSLQASMGQHSSSPSTALASIPRPANCAPIFNLPAVLVHLTMQYLFAREIIALARCSTRLYRDGGDPHAWKCTAITLHMRPRLAAGSHPFNPPSTLLARAAVEVTLHCNLDAMRGFDAPHFVGFLDQLPADSVHALVVSQSRLDRHSEAIHAIAFQQVLSHPALRSLVRLRFFEEDQRSGLWKGFGAEIAQLPALKHLELFEFSIRDTPLEWLPRCPALTSLQICGVGTRRLNHISQCARLTELALVEPAISLTELHDFLLSTNMRRLMKLRLDRTPDRMTRMRRSALNLAPPQPTYAEAFASMDRLQELHLSRMPNIDALLPHVARCPQLRLCILEPEIHSAMDTVDLPPTEQMRALLKGAPQLTLVLRLQAPYRQQWLLAEMAARLQPAVADLRADFPDRFQCEMP